MGEKQGSLCKLLTVGRGPRLGPRLGLAIEVLPLGVLWSVCAPLLASAWLAGVPGRVERRPSTQVLGRDFGDEAQTWLRVSHRACFTSIANMVC